MYRLTVYVLAATSIAHASFQQRGLFADTS